MQDALEDMDSDHGGTVDFDEFLEWYLGRLPVVLAEKQIMESNLASEEDVRQAFRFYNKVPLQMAHQTHRLLSAKKYTHTHNARISDN